MLAAISILYTSIYIHVLYSHKVWRTLKDTFEHQILKPQLKINRKKIPYKSLKMSKIGNFADFSPFPATRGGLIAQNYEINISQNTILAKCTSLGIMSENLV